MQPLLAIVVGALYTAGLYLMLRRSLVGLIIGLALLGHAANLLIFTAAGLTRGRAPLLVDGVPPSPMADPLPQAVILTAIVIGFGVLAFALVLFRRGAEHAGTDDLDAMRTTES
ncbi:MAG TPA: Na+/H+ antiporter subunit C [Vicinamibacterales bacterium]|nr:Na+/H+ antiporter subunit C [Vicinamibacterales bacterium]